jgi:hypothetical protein
MVDLDFLSPLPPTDERGTRYGRLLVFGTEYLDTAVKRDYLLKGLISRGEISLWCGPPKCGKSFLLLFIAYMLSLGHSIFGRRVKQTKVLYVAAEGEGGIANRITALQRRYGHSPNFRWIAQPADLLHEHGHLEELKSAAKGADLIVLDTLSRMMAGGDENSPRDMGKFIWNVTELKNETGAHIAIVHHGTKSSNGSSPRGHGSLEGADEALIEVAKQGDGSRTATVIHTKDDKDGMQWAFDLEQVELGIDDDGDPITTLVVKEKIEVSTVTPAKKPKALTRTEQAALTCLDEMLRASSITATVGDAFEARTVTTAAAWKECFYRKAKPGDTQDTKLKAFNRARDGLIAKGRVTAEGDYIYRLDPR